jgi:hypothetical protein
MFIISVRIPTLGLGVIGGGNIHNNKIWVITKTFRDFSKTEVTPTPATGSSLRKEVPLKGM